jgi:hypothetical protein
LIRDGLHKKWDVQQFFIVACVFVAMVVFLPSLCLVTVGEYICRHIECWEGFMKYTIELGSGAMIDITKFHKYSFRHSEVHIKGIHRETAW